MAITSQWFWPATGPYWPPWVSDLPQGFLHPKTSQSHVWEEMRLFGTLLLINHQILFLKKRNFGDNFSAKIEVSGQIKTNMAAASYHPWILSPRYGKTGNVQQLTANGKLSFAVKWPNLILTCLLLWIARLHSRRNLTLATNLLSNYEKITASYQINISGSESIYISNVKNNKNELLKTLLGNCKQVFKNRTCSSF